MFLAQRSLFVGGRPDNILSDKQPDNLQLHSGTVVAADGARNRSLKIGKFLNVLLKRAPCQLCACFAFRHDHGFIVFAEDVNLLAQRLGTLPLDQDCEGSAVT